MLMTTLRSAAVLCAWAFELVDGVAWALCGGVEVVVARGVAFLFRDHKPPPVLIGTPGIGCRCCFNVEQLGGVVETTNEVLSCPCGSVVGSTVVVVVVVVVDEGSHTRIEDAEAVAFCAQVHRLKTVGERLLLVRPPAKEHHDAQPARSQGGRAATGAAAAAAAAAEPHSPSRRCTPPPSSRLPVAVSDVAVALRVSVWKTEPKSSSTNRRRCPFSIFPMHLLAPCCAPFWWAPVLALFGDWAHAGATCDSSKCYGKPLWQCQLSGCSGILYVARCFSFDVLHGARVT
jgi:hypothetical protein